MVRKKDLIKQLEEEKNKIKKLEEKIDSLKSELEKEKLINKSLIKEIKEGNQFRKGKFTTMLTCEVEAGHYLCDENADRSKAEEPLDVMIALRGITENKEIPIILCADRDGKKHVRFHRPTQKEIETKGFNNVTDAILNIYDRKKARTMYYIHKKITDAKEPNSHLSHISHINLPPYELSGKYFVQKIIDC